MLSDLRLLTAFSICCNITAGLIIAIGDRLSRKKEVLEKRMHQAITAEAIHRKHLEQKLAIRENTEPGQCFTRTYLIIR